MERLPETAVIDPSCSKKNPFSGISAIKFLTPGGKLPPHPGFQSTGTCSKRRASGLMICTRSSPLTTTTPQGKFSSTRERYPRILAFSSRLRSNARALRKNSTAAERILWSELRDHRLNGASFRRQVPVATYIADFVCHAAKLVIELDGGQHFSDAQEVADARRSAIIEAKGFRVLRFSNHDVMTNRVGVLETIATAIGANAPTLTFPRKREREEEQLPAGKRPS